MCNSATHAAVTPTVPPVHTRVLTCVAHFKATQLLRTHWLLQATVPNVARMAALQAGKKKSEQGCRPLQPRFTNHCENDMIAALWLTPGYVRCDVTLSQSARPSTAQP